MTPIWTRLVKANVRTGLMPPDHAERLADAFRCFDMRGVEHLCAQVWQELFIAGGDDTSFLYDLGEKCAFPCDSFWLEFAGNGLLVERHADNWYVYEVWAESGVPPYLRCVAIIETAGDFFQLQIPDTLPLGSEANLMSRRWGGWVLGSLAVMNSPRTVAKREARKLPSKKLGQRKGRALELTRILIDVGSGRAASTCEMQQTGSPKAYHFVRSHFRRLGDRATVVRAHWRGDPTLGFRIGSYAVTDSGTVH